MQTAIEFAPWIVFGLVYKFGGGLYPATGALMPWKKKRGWFR